MKAGFTKDKSFLVLILGCLYSMINNLSNIFLLIISAIFCWYLSMTQIILSITKLFLLSYSEFFLLFFVAVASVLGKP